MNYSIGRGTNTYDEAGKNWKKLIVPNHQLTKEVAANHAKLFLDQGMFTIEPIDPSVNHVYVNGFRVKRKLLSPDYEIQLGSSYKFFIHYFFHLKDGKVMRERNNFDFTEEFLSLEPIWQAHLNSDRKMENKETALQAASKIPYLGPMLKTIYLERQQEKNNNARQAHKASTLFICPMCRQPLLEKSWYEWKEVQGHSCGAIWK